VWDRLFRLKQRGVTLILTTHYMDEAEQLCDRLVVMDHGTFAAEGSPRDLITRYLLAGGPRAALRPGPARAGRGQAQGFYPPNGPRFSPTASCSTSATG